MGLLDSIRTRIARWLSPAEYADPATRQQAIDNELRRAYYEGEHKRPFKVKPGQADDNLINNYTRLVIDRSVSMTLGRGVKFDAPGEQDDPRQDFIDRLWDINGRDTLLHKLALYATIYGTGYIKLLPGEIEADGRQWPRIIALDPRWLRIHTAPEDPDTVVAYETRFMVTVNGREIQRREVITREPADTEDTGEPQPVVADTWEIREYTGDTAGRWQLTDTTPWAHTTAPIIHWQNLPAGGTPYGESEVDGILPLQDRINYVSSNISRILRYHAHPKTWGRGVFMGNQASWGPDEIVMLTGDNASLQNLEMQSDLTAAGNYLEYLRQSLFDISRTIDLGSIHDKLGALTNFGIRVMYADALAKIETKRRLMGTAIAAAGGLAMELAGMADPDPGIVIWPDPLPSNRIEELQAGQLAIDLGIASKQTLAAAMGYNWDQEQDRIQEEAAAGDNVGAALLRAFNQGVGA